MTDTPTEMSDVLVQRTGELAPDITEPTVIGAVVRVPDGYELADAINLAGTVITHGTKTETLRVVVAGADELGDDEPFDPPPPGSTEAEW